MHTSHGITTTHIAEGDKLFFTNARVDSRVGSLSTSNLSEGTNLYYTNARADARIALQVGSNLDLSSKSTSDLSEGTNLYYTQARFNTAFTAKSTSDLSEGTNLYYTDARADARITAADTDSLSEGSTNLYYTDARADARVALIVDSAPGTLNTLNELAAALGDDANFSTTVTNSIATKLPLAGGTLTGFIQLGANQLRFDQSGTRSWTVSASGGNLNINSGDSVGNVAISSGLTVEDNATFAGNGEFNTSLKINAPDDGGAPAMTAIMNMHGYEGRGVGIKMKDNVNSASGSTDREWFVGTGYNSSGFNIGYASGGSQSSYPAQAKLSITTSGNATFAGNVTVGNNGNINIPTAASGNANLNFDGTDFKITSNSSSANLKLETNSTTRLTINSSGNATFTGNVTASSGTGYFSLVNASGYQLNGTYVMDSSRNLVNIANITSSGTGAFSGAVNFTGNMTAKNTKFLGGNSYNENIRMHPGSNDYSSLILGAVSGDSGTGAGQWSLVRYPNANSNKFTIRHNSTDHVTITTSGNVTNHVDTRSPIFYDSNNTSYYFNGADTSVSAQVAGPIVSLGPTSGTTAANQAFQVNTTTKGALHSTAASGGTNGSADTAPLVTFTGNGTTVQGGMYVSQNASTGTTLGFFTTDSYATGPKQSLTIQHNGNTYVNRGFLQVSTDVRAPLFYDLNDTAYYTNPANTSRLHHIVVGDGTPDTTPDGTTFSNTIKSTGGSTRVVNFEGAGNSISTWYTVGNTAYGAIDQNSTYMSLWQNQGLGWQEQFRIYRGYQQSLNQLRAPIFYDSNDTGYYLNPASTSILNRVEIDDDLDVRAQVGTWITSNIMSDAIGWNNSYGVYIGSNVGGTHYLRGNGTFTTGGNTYNLWHQGNDGSGSGLDADLLDGSHASAFWAKSGSWYGDLGSHSYTREIGLSMTGGSEFVVLSKSGQGSVLVDGHYMAYESANGFFGSFNSTYGNLTGIRATAANTLKVMQLDGGNAILEVTQDARAPIFYDSNNTAFHYDGTGGSQQRYTFNVSGANGSYGSQIIAGQTSIALPYTLQDTNQRPILAATGPYPVLHLNHTSNTNTNHGPTIQFTHNGVTDDRQWVFGSTGDGVSLDIGFSSDNYYNPNDYNPHNGISGYRGKTYMRFRENGNIGLGASNGGWGGISGGNPAYAIDTKGTLHNNTDVRAPIFYDSTDTAYYGDFNGKSHFNKIAGIRVNRATSEGWAEIDAWNVGTQTGYFGGAFTINGSSNENNIAYEDMPNTNTSTVNKKGLVWKVTTNSSDSGADGGWNKTIGGVNYNRGHISVLYVKRIADGNGNFYHGTSTCQNLDGSTNTNPYFQAVGAQSLPLGVWCVSIGYIRGNNDSSTASTNFSGVYRLDTGERILGATDYRFAQSTTSQHRCFLYYATNTSSELWFTNPGFYEINGLEPNINELLMRPEDRVDSIRANLDLRSPIYYDSNDTGFYVNPASESKIAKLWINNGGAGGVGWSTGFNQGSGSNYWNMIQDGGVARQRNFGTGGYDWFSSSAAQLMTLSNGGTLFAAADMRSPIFYDSNDTNYLVNPHDESRLHTLNIENGTTSNNRIVFKASTTSGYGALRFNYNNTEQNTLHMFGSTWSTNFEGGSRGAINLSPYTGVTFGSWNSPGGWVYNSGQAQFNNSVRSPIFYDSNDTGYYVNPATSSNLKGIVTNTSSNTVGSQLKIYTTTNHQYPQIYSNGSREAMWNYKNSAAEWYVGIRTSSQLLGTSGFHFYNTTSGQTVGGWDINGHSYSIGSSRAPIFYDSNNTGYYVHGDSGSRLLRLGLNVAPDMASCW